MHELIRDITLCILFAGVSGLLAHFFRQPPIPSLPYRRVLDWSIQHRAGKVAGIDQHHLRAWPA
jgi:hypothetical protein